MQGFQPRRGYSKRSDDRDHQTPITRLVIRIDPGVIQTGWDGRVGKRKTNNIHCVAVLRNETVADRYYLCTFDTEAPFASPHVMIPFAT